MQQRLTLEAELVPCPSCHWISGELVRGYRRARYRPMRKVAFVVGFVGTVIALLCAWFISIGPPRDRGTLPYLLYGGPALFMSLAGGIGLLQWWLRQRIQPNRDFPRPPVVPPGTPTALLLDEATGELRPSAPFQPGSGVVTDYFDIQIGRQVLPMVCCECLRPASAEHAFVVPVGQSASLAIPRCPDCAGSASPPLGWPILATVGLFVAAGAMAVWLLESPTSSYVVIGLLVLMCVTVVWLASRAARFDPVEVVFVDAPRGVVRLRFRNPGYGEVIAKHRIDLNPN